MIHNLSYRHSFTQQKAKRRLGRPYVPSFPQPYLKKKSQKVTIIIRLLFSMERSPRKEKLMISWKNYVH
jgi:hypothetical protein